MLSLRDEGSCSGSFCPTCDVFIPNEVSMNAHLVGKKHLKNIVREEQWKQSAERSVYVNGIKPLISAELQLADYFGRFGGVEKITLDKTQKNYAIIEMADKESTSNILSCSQHEINGVTVTVKPRELKAVKRDRKSKPKESQLDKELWKALIGCENSERQLDVLQTSLQLSDDEIHVRDLIVQLLKSALREGFPGCLVVPFGSSVNGLGSHNCDLDLHFQYFAIHPDIVNEFKGVAAEDSPDSRPETYSQADVLQAVSAIVKECIPDCVRVKPILHARLPVVKFQHMTSGIKCDISLSNEIAVENTRYLKMCIEAEPKFKKLTYFVRAWMKHMELTGYASVASGIRLNNYTATLLALFYLQSTNQLPSLEEMRLTIREKVTIGGWDCTFPDRQENILSKCKKSVTDLIPGFFEFYSDFEFSDVVFDTTTAKIIEISSLPDLGAIESTDNCVPCWRKHFKFGALNIRDPFELSHNVAGNVSKKHAKVLSKCLRSAAFATKMKLFSSKPSKGNASWGILNVFVDHSNKSLTSGGAQHSISIKVQKGEFETAVGIIVKVLEGVFMINCDPANIPSPGLTAKSANTNCNMANGNEKNIVAVKTMSTPQKPACSTAADLETISLKRHASPDACGYCKRAKTELSSPVAREIMSSQLDCIPLPFSANCSATHRLWQGRRRARRRLVTSGLSDLLELEQLVSKLLLSEEKSVPQDGHLNDSSSTAPCDGALFEFKLHITIEDELSFNLLFQPLDNNITDLSLFVSHLKTFLPGFVIKCLKNRTP